MKKFKIKLFESVNDIPFGTDREIVRNKIGEKYTEFRKSKFSKNTSDDYGAAHFFYDIDNHLEAIEIFKGCTIFIDEQEYPFDYGTILAWIKSIDNDTIENEYGIISTKMSVGVYAPMKQIESILFAREGYYSYK